MRHICRLIARIDGPLLFPSIALAITESGFSITLLVLFFRSHPPSVLIAHVAGMTICFLGAIVIAPILYMRADAGKTVPGKKSPREKLKIKKLTAEDAPVTKVDSHKDAEDREVQGANRIAQIISMLENIAEDLK